MPSHRVHWMLTTTASLTVVVGTSAALFAPEGAPDDDAMQRIEALGGSRTIAAERDNLEMLRESLAEQLGDDESLAALDAELREQFVVDISALLATWTCGSKEEYFQLMQQWGGTYNFQDGGGVPGVSWLEKTDDLAIAEVVVSDATARVVAAHEVRDGIKLIRTEETGRPGRMTASMFNFGTSPFVLLSSCEYSTEAFLSMNTRNGTWLDMRVWMAWDDGRRRWVPCMTNMHGEKRKPLPSIFF